MSRTRVATCSHRSSRAASSVANGSSENAPVSCRSHSHFPSSVWSIMKPVFRRYSDILFRWPWVSCLVNADCGSTTLVDTISKDFNSAAVSSLGYSIVPWAYFASNFYHNVYWYPFVGHKRVEEAIKTKWGQLFKKYGDGKEVMPGMERKTIYQAMGAIVLAGAALIALLVAIF